MPRKTQIPEQMTKVTYVIRGEYELSPSNTVPEIIQNLEEAQERLREVGSAEVEVTIPAPQTIKF